MNIVYYDLETVGYELAQKGHETKVVKKGTVTSVAYKVGNDPINCLTIGVNCKNELELKDEFRKIVKDRNNCLVAWNGANFDDAIIKRIYGRKGVKCRFFDLMQGYAKFVKQKGSSLISLNTVANELDLSKDDINPIEAYNNNEYELLHKYNIKDVELLQAIDDKYNIINIMCTLLKTTNVKHPNNLFGVTKPLETYIGFNNIELGSNKRNDLYNCGGLNYIQNRGKFDNLQHYDVRSFYPYMILALNGSSNLNYDIFEVREVSSVENLTKHGNIYFNDNATLQVKEIDGKLIAIELNDKFNLRDGNGDISDLTGQLVEFKNNTDGDLRQAYKILVNGLYGALDSKYFKYQHKNLSAAVTFLCRYVLFNVIKEFNGVYAKTDSVWCPNTTSEELNSFTASLLKPLGLRTYDKDGSYLIQWEHEADVNTLFIKDLNNYVENINGKWKYKGSFTVPIQKEAVKTFILNPNTDIDDFINSTIANIKSYCEYSKLSHKQRNQWKQNTILSDKLGLTYEYGFKVYRYYSVDGWVNTDNITVDNLPDVNFDYAKNRVTKILNQYGFIDYIHDFHDDKPEKNGVNAQVDIGQTTNLDGFVEKDMTLKDVIAELTEISHGSDKNYFKMALVGTAYRNGYDVRPIAREVFKELGYHEAYRTTNNIPLKSNGYGYKTLVELTENKELCTLFVKLLKQELEPLKVNKPLPVDTIKPKGELLANINSFIEEIKQLRENNKPDIIKAIVTSIKYNTGLNYTELNRVNKDTAYLLNSLYFEVEGSNKEKRQNEINRLRYELIQRYNDLKYRYEGHVTSELKKYDITWNTLIGYLKVKIPNYVGDYEQLLKLMLIYVAPLRLIINIIANSSGGKNYHIALLEQIRENSDKVNEVSVSSFYKIGGLNNHYYWFNKWLIFDDISDQYLQAADFSKHVLKKLITEGTVKRLLTGKNSDRGEEWIKHVNEDWKCILASTKPMTSYYDEQLRSRSFDYYLEPITEQNEPYEDDGTPDIRNMRYFLDIFTKDYEYTYNKDLLKSMGYYEDMKSLFYVDGVYMNRLKKNLTAIIHFLNTYCPEHVISDYIDELTSVSKLDVKAWVEAINTIVEPQYYDIELHDLKIAKSKTYHAHVKKLGKKDAFTFNAFSGIRTKTVKDNVHKLRDILKELETQGIVKNVGKHNKANVYILVKENVQEYLE